MTEADAIIAEARAWIGTPYQHQASARGYGTDCLGLIRGVWRACVGPEQMHVPAYSPDWSEASGDERLWRAANRFLVPVPLDLGSKGHVLLFRMRKSAVAKHVGLIASHRHGFTTLIHAYSGQSVVETPLSEAWRSRAVAQFKFPERNL